MNSNDVNVGLLTNSQNPKYKQTSSEGFQIELQDVNEEPSYIAFDEKDNQCQYAELPLQNPWNQPAGQMLRNDAPQQPVPKNPPPMSSSLPSQSPQVQIQASMWNVSQSQTYYTQQSLIDNRSGQQPIQHQSLPQQQQQQQYRQQQQYACCTFCQTSQLIGNPNTPFMCYACKKIVQANFSYFICGVCRTNVMYQTGVSNIIKCTKCMTVNYVQQPNLPNQSPQAPPQQKPQAPPQQTQQAIQPARSAPQQSKILGNQVDPL